MIKIVLIRPPRPLKDATFISLQFPLNLGYLAGYLCQKGHDLEIWDYEVEKFNEDSLCRRVLKAKPKVAGLTCLTPTVNYAHRIASLVKKASPETVTVAGGPHPTALPAETLREFTDFDIVVIGEGEETLWEIVRCLEEDRPFSGIKGLAYREADGAVKIERPRPYFGDLDILPFPKRDLVKHSLYRSHHVSRAFSRKFLKISEIIAGRGCPNECIFCTCHNRVTRFRSAANVLAEAEECIKRYGTAHFSFLDDTLTLRPAYVRELSRGLRKFKKVTWDCFARVDTVSLELLKEMVESGCRKISYGVESGSPRILKLLKKNIDLEQVRSAFALSRAAGVKYVEASFMIGAYPEENREDIALTAELIFELEPDILMLSLTVPYPGTEIYKMMKEGGYLDPDLSWDNFIFFGDKLSWRNDNFSAEELIALYKALARKFYLRPKYIFSTLKKVRSTKELFYWLKAGASFIKSTG